MINALLGEKIDQSQAFTPEGKRIPVTTIMAGPCWVSRVETVGAISHVQLGFGNTKRTTKSKEGHFKKAGLTNKPRFLRDVEVSEVTDDIKPGTEITASQVFAVGDVIRVIGTSKGKGFAGVVMRHNFRGGPRTHGQSDRERSPGSIGQTTTPGRVYRGKRMAGRMGSERVTVKGLEIVAVDQEKNLVTVKGLIPGAKHSFVIIQKET
jgi:large subunit ribosomal protein L3